MTREELIKKETEQYPDQSITWEMEKEVPATKVLVDIEAGNRTNLMMNVLHLPQDALDKWMDSIKDLVIDVTKSIMGEEKQTTVGMSVGQQHIADWLNTHASQQQLLFFACNHIYQMSINMAEMKRDKDINGILGLLQHLHGDGDRI